MNIKRKLHCSISYLYTVSSMVGIRSVLKHERSVCELSMCECVSQWGCLDMDSQPCCQLSPVYRVILWDFPTCTP